MKYSEFKQAVESLRACSATSAVVYLVFDGESGPRARLMDVENQNQKSIAECYLKGLVKDVAELAEDSQGDFEFQKLSVADDRSCKVYEYDLEMSDRLAFISNLYTNGEYQKFSLEEDDLSALSGYAIVLGTDETKMVLYRKHMPVNTYVPKSLCFFNDGTRFKRFTKSLIRLEADCHLAFINQKLIIRNLNVAERYLGIREVIVKEAKKFAESESFKDVVHASEKFAQWVDSDPAFARRLIRVQKSSPVLGCVDVEHIAEFILNRSHLANKIQIVQTEDGPRVVINSKSSGKLFLKVLNDDYLKSELTAFDYESVAKNQLKTDLQ